MKAETNGDVAMVLFNTTNHYYDGIGINFGDYGSKCQTYKNKNQRASKDLKQGNKFHNIKIKADNYETRFYLDGRQIDKI